MREDEVECMYQTGHQQKGLGLGLYVFYFATVRLFTWNTEKIRILSSSCPSVWISQNYLSHFTSDLRNSKRFEFLVKNWVDIHLNILYLHWMHTSILCPFKYVDQLNKKRITFEMIFNLFHVLNCVKTKSSAWTEQVISRNIFIYLMSRALAQCERSEHWAGESFSSDLNFFIYFLLQITFKFLILIRSRHVQWPTRYFT